MYIHKRILIVVNEKNTISSIIIFSPNRFREISPIAHQAEYSDTKIYAAVPKLDHLYPPTNYPQPKNKIERPWKKDV